MKTTTKALLTNCVARLSLLLRRNKGILRVIKGTNGKKELALVMTPETEQLCDEVIATYYNRWRELEVYHVRANPQYGDSFLTCVSDGTIDTDDDLEQFKKEFEHELDKSWYEEYTGEEHWGEFPTFYREIERDCVELLQERVAKELKAHSELLPMTNLNVKNTDEDNIKAAAHEIAFEFIVNGDGLTFIQYIITNLEKCKCKADCVDKSWMPPYDQPDEVQCQTETM